MSVPGQTSFTRFVKLPPVETRKIPDIVRFEAEQQIPFAIEEVIWRYQTFQDPDSPDVEVGIFAMKRLDVDAVLSHFTDVGVAVDLVQMAPLSLYNFMTFDSQLAADGATLLADVGAEKTDLVVADGTRIWTRTIQIGGNSFTQALVRVFKLSFTKAEKLIFVGEVELSQDAAKEAISSLDKAAKKGCIHPKNAARRKSRLMHKLNKAQETPST